MSQAKMVSGSAAWMACKRCRALWALGRLSTTYTSLGTGVTVGFARPAASSGSNCLSSARLPSLLSPSTSPFCADCSSFSMEPKSHMQGCKETGSSGATSSCKACTHPTILL